MSAALSMSEPVPVLQARVKKLKGTSPHNTKTGNCGRRLGKITVKTKVSAAMVTRGFSNDQRTPRDMLRYRTLKSFWIRLANRKA